MEITDFLTKEFLLTFIGTIISVELIVAYTKELKLIKRIPTKLYTLIWAIIHIVIINIATGIVSVSVVNIYVLLINALVISTLLTGGYDMFIGKINITGIGEKE